MYMIEQVQRLYMHQASPKQQNIESHCAEQTRPLQQSTHELVLIIVVQGHKHNPNQADDDCPRECADGCHMSVNRTPATAHCRFKGLCTHIHVEVAVCVFQGLFD